jgi:hypothetical protein
METRKCARCNESYALSVRAGRNTERAKAGRKRTYHRGRLYCSDNCRKRDHEARTGALKARPATTPLSIVPNSSLPPLALAA